MKKVTSEKQVFWLALAVMFGLVVVQVPIWYGVGVFAQKLFDNRMIEQQLWVVRQRNESAWEQLTAQTNYLSQLDMVVPNISTLAQEIERMERLADEAGIVLNTNEIKEEDLVGSQAGSLLKVANVTLDLVGDPEQLLVFLGQLEHLQELTEVTEISLRQWTSEAQVTEDGRQAYILSVRVKFYMQNNGE